MSKKPAVVGAVPRMLVMLLSRAKCAVGVVELLVNKFPAPSEVRTTPMTFVVSAWRITRILPAKSADAVTKSPSVHVGAAALASTVNAPMLFVDGAALLFVRVPVTAPVIVPVNVPVVRKFPDKSVESKTWSPVV